jgi:phosphoglycolate phosphatase-like HAD superfamily hydrolase
MADTAIFDVDGTLVDTNYQHALAWFRAFRRYGITRPMWPKASMPAWANPILNDGAQPSVAVARPGIRSSAATPVGDASAVRDCRHGVRRGSCRPHPRHRAGRNGAGSARHLQRMPPDVA